MMNKKFLKQILNGSGGRKRNRLEGYDYRRSGYYFVTICTQYRSHYFGEIHNGMMCINDLGNVVVR